MNRTDRLYALVEELRAVAPRPRSARWLADRFEVSVRTIERDILAVQQAGVPVYGEPGRTGGYTVDPDRTLPPLRFTAEETVALTVGLERLTSSPFQLAARSALQKVLAVMPGADVMAAQAFAERVQLVERPPDRLPTVPMVLQEALSQERVLTIDYADRNDVVSHRTVEPIGFIGSRDRWYLLAWCRLRHGVRAFRLDRIRHAKARDERVPARRDLPALDIPDHLVRTLSLTPT